MLWDVSRQVVQEEFERDLLEPFGIIFNLWVRQWT